MFFTSFFILLILFLFPTAGQSAILTHGPVVGGVDSSNGKVFVRTDVAATVEIEYATDPNLVGSLLTPPLNTASGSDFTVHVPLSGLLTATTYYINVRVNGIGQLAPPFPSFATFALAGSSQDFKFIALTDFRNQNNVTVTWPTFFSAGQEGAKFAFIGGDFDHRNPSTLTSKRKMFKALYDPASLGLADFVNLILRKMPIAHHWDDHDAGLNNIDKTYSNWNLSYQAFNEYTPTYPLIAPPSSFGIWQQFRYAQADFWVLDNRSQRDRNDAPDDVDKSMLNGRNLPTSQSQLEWLKNGLLASTARWKIIFSSVITNPSTKCPDGWCGYQTEWNALKTFIQTNGITGIVFVSGDLHMGGIDNGIASGFVEMTVPQPNDEGTTRCSSANPGNWSEGRYFNLAGPCNGYSVVTVLTNPDRVLLEVKDQNGIVKVTYTVF